MNTPSPTPPHHRRHSLPPDGSDPRVFAPLRLYLFFLGQDQKLRRTPALGECLGDLDWKSHLQDSRVVWIKTAQPRSVHARPVYTFPPQIRQTSIEADKNVTTIPYFMLLIHVTLHVSNKAVASKKFDVYHIKLSTGRLHLPVLYLVLVSFSYLQSLRLLCMGVSFKTLHSF